jgi:hypothetical protein
MASAAEEDARNSRRVILGTATIYLAVLLSFNAFR